MSLEKGTVAMASMYSTIAAVLRPFFSAASSASCTSSGGGAGWKSAAVAKWLARRMSRVSFFMGLVLEAVDFFQGFVAVHRAVEVAQAAVMHAVDESMHKELLPARPGALHFVGFADVFHLFDDV